MTAGASRAFAQMIRDCGPTVFRMSTSCDLYLGQYLAQYPQEKKLLSDALRAGVPNRLVEYDAPDGYDHFLERITAEFVRVAKVDAETAGWAVSRWAEAVGKPAGYTAPPPVLRPAFPDLADPRAAGPGGGHAVMTLLVGFGGFLGGTLGLALPFLLMATGVFATDPKMSGASFLKGTAGLLLLCSVGGGVGGMAAVLGWLFGRGDDKPWAGFAAAFGAAFTMNVFALFAFGLLVGGIASFGCTFAAVFRCASRGGQNY